VNLSQYIYLQIHDQFNVIHTDFIVKVDDVVIANDSNNNYTFVKTAASHSVVVIY